MLNVDLYLDDDVEYVEEDVVVEGCCVVVSIPSSTSLLLFGLTSVGFTGVGHLKGFENLSSRRIFNLDLRS